MSERYNYYDYDDNNWDDSEVIDKLPVKEVIDEYRRVGKNEELIYGWCVWRREFEKYQRIKKQMGPEWTAEHSVQLTWNLKHDILQDCRENDLMDMWYFRQKIENPWRESIEDYADIVDDLYKQYGSVEKELQMANVDVQRLLRVQEQMEKKEQEQRETQEPKKRRGFFHRH